MDLPGMRTKHYAHSRNSTADMTAVQTHPFPSEQQVRILTVLEEEVDPTILHSALADTRIRQREYKTSTAGPKHLPPETVLLIVN